MENLRIAVLELLNRLDLALKDKSSLIGHSPFIDDVAVQGRVVRARLSDLDLIPKIPDLETGEIDGRLSDSPKPVAFKLHWDDGKIEWIAESTLNDAINRSCYATASHLDAWEQWTQTNSGNQHVTSTQSGEQIVPTGT